MGPEMEMHEIEALSQIRLETMKKECRVEAKGKSLRKAEHTH